MSNLKKTLAVVSLLAPVSAHPLGIGDIELNSVLNEKLNASIKLHLAGENPSDIRVHLASPEKFDQAGVPWSYSLSKLKFDPVVKPDGSMVIKVTTREAYVEPFLNFLLEVSWPQGDLVREFTLLIDPPSEYAIPSLPTGENRDYQADSAIDNFDDRPIKKRKTARVSARSSSPVGNITPQSPINGEVGPVRAQDTLWGVAESLAAKQGVSTNQMMTALYRANPDAFIHGDMNLLKAGVILKVPELAPNLQSSGQKPAGTSAPTNKSLKLVAPGESSIPENAEPTDTGKGQNGSAQGNRADNRGSGKDLELQVRIEKLQEQLNMMQQLLALKDQQLNALQNKDKTVPSVNPSPISTTSLPTVSPTTKSQQSGGPTAESGQQVPPVGQQPVATIAPTVKPTAAITATAKPLTQASKPPSTEEDSSSYYLSLGGISVAVFALIGGLWWRKRKIEERTNSESMFASASQIKMPDSDSSLSVPVVDINNAASYDVGTVGESSFISDFTPSDFDAFDTDQNDVDPLSEADVYLAYGRYQQAEDLIRHAIKDSPDRDDYKLKLLEILYANENKDAFAVYAQELSAAGKQEDRVFWTKVTDMGKEILPENRLFGGSSDLGSPIKNTDSIDETANVEVVDEVENSYSYSEDLLNLDDAGLPDLELMNDINSELAELQLDSDDAGSSNNRSLDFDLSDFAPSSATSKREANLGSQSDEIETIDFDLSGMSGGSRESSSTSAVDSQPDSLTNFDFNFDSDLSDSDTLSAKNDASNQTPLDMTSLESFEFPDFNSASETDETVNIVPEPKAELVDAEKTTASDNFDFNFDFEAPAALENVPEEDDLGVFDLTDMDEFETKIDLAKAYIDMGDTEMAKKIAKEVLEKGSKEQQQTAQSILDEL